MDVVEHNMFFASFDSGAMHVTTAAAMAERQTSDIYMFVCDIRSQHCVYQYRLVMKAMT